MSTTALFYPHTTVAAPRRQGESQNYNRMDTKLLTTALLLWDDVEVIVPWSGYRPQVVVGDDQIADEESINEAFEMLVRPRVVSTEGANSEMDRIYKELETLVSAGVPETLKFEVEADNYNFYPEKLDGRIWRLLEDKGLMGDGSKGYYGVKRDLGLVIMGIVAEVCAGSLRKKVTNYADAHEAYCRLVAAQKGGEVTFKAEVEHAHTKLVSKSILSINAGAFPLKKLVDLRKREKEDGLLPILRVNYRDAVDRYVDRLSKEAKSQADVDLIERQFETEMTNDFRHLQEMLQLEVGGSFLTKGIQALLNILSGRWDQLAALADSGPVFKLKKQGVLEKHKTGWLHAA